MVFWSASCPQSQNSTWRSSVTKLQTSGTNSQKRTSQFNKLKIKLYSFHLCFYFTSMFTLYSTLCFNSAAIQRKILHFLLIYLTAAFCRTGVQKTSCYNSNLANSFYTLSDVMRGDETLREETEINMH